MTYEEMMKAEKYDPSMGVSCDRWRGMIYDHFMQDRPSYAEWMKGWGVSSKGTPYRASEGWEPDRSMGIKPNAKGHHFWITTRLGATERFEWSEGYETEEEAYITLYDYLYRGGLAVVMTSEKSRFAS